MKKLTKCTLWGAFGLTLVVGLITFERLYPRFPQTMTFDATSRRDWEDRAVRYLQAFKPNYWTPRATFDRYQSEEFGAHVNYTIKNAGIIRFPDGDWVFILTHSFHQDEREGTEIGDHVLAIDNHRKMWMAHQHPCSSVSMMPRSRKEFSCENEFLQTEVGVLSFTNWVAYPATKIPRDLPH
jgi:hypothetical protein